MGLKCEVYIWISFYDSVFRFDYFIYLQKVQLASVYSWETLTVFKVGANNLQLRGSDICLKYLQSIFAHIVFYYFIYLLFIHSSPKICLARRGGGGGRREGGKGEGHHLLREKHLSCAFHMLQLEMKPTIQHPEQEQNQQPFSVRDDAQPIEPLRPGLYMLFLYYAAAKNYIRYFKDQL